MNLTLSIDPRGVCSWRLSYPGNKSTPGTCDGPLFKATPVCGSFLGDLVILLSDGLSGDTSVLLQLYMELLGLNRVTYVGSLSLDDRVFNRTTAAPVLNSLREVGGDLRMSGSFRESPGLLGLANVQQVRGRVEITGTYLRDPSLPALVCIGQSLSIRGNWIMANFTGGMGRLASIYNPTPMDDGTIINISENNGASNGEPGYYANSLLNSPESMAPLARIGNCGGTLPQGQNILVASSACAPFRTWRDLCSYVATSNCQRLPPPPPRS